MGYAKTNQEYCGYFENKEFNTKYEYLDKAPSQWCADRGATHTIYVGPFSETRPARILKSVAYVGIDEENDQLVWEKWEIKNHKNYRAEV